MTDKKIDPEATPNGIKIGCRVIGWSGAIHQFDGPHFDHCILDGMLWWICIQESKLKGWITPKIEQEIILWRWIVVAVFINEERKKNGTVKVKNQEGSTDEAVIYYRKNFGISIYPGPERLALANHIEGYAIKQYGVEVGLTLALRIYQDMVTTSPDDGLKLSLMGREGLDLLHDSFIEHIQTDGIPESPVIH